MENSRYSCITQLCLLDKQQNGRYHQTEHLLCMYENGAFFVICDFSSYNFDFSHRLYILGCPLVRVDCRASDILF